MRRSVPQHELERAMFDGMNANPGVNPEVLRDIGYTVPETEFVSKSSPVNVTVMPVEFKAFIRDLKESNPDYKKHPGFDGTTALYNQNRRIVNGG
ncbi:hypothetical protein KC959_04435 [Candidatus Saccharibacteria bacterium]|nr:hypothetical protein [Candidatus Saccharibacteria bacterium]